MRTKVLVLTTLLTSACGAPGPRPEPSDRNSAPVAPAMANLSAATTPLRAVTIRGTLGVRREGAQTFEPMALNASLVGVRELKADRRGAVIAIGADARIYLRGGSHVMIAEGKDGVRVAVATGRARLLSGEVKLVAVTAAGEQAGDDLLVDIATATPTSARPEAAAWSLALEAPETARSVGTMEAGDQKEAVTLKRVEIDVTTAGDLAVTEVTHIFHSSASELREGTFRFPVPDGAMLIGLALEVNGKLMEGEIVEKEKARQVYEKIVDEMLDPALLEWEEGNWFKLRVFPLEPNQDKRVVIRYLLPLEREGSDWQYAATIAGSQPIADLTVRVDGQVALSEQQVTGIDLAVPVATARVPAVMREIRDDGVYTAVRITPTFEAAAPARGGPRKVAIVVDTSRSSLEARPQELDVLAKAIGTLGDQDTFVVLASDVATHAQTTTFVAPTPEAMHAAADFISAIEPDGATDVAAALAAVDALDPTDVVYIGDGIATWGERQPKALAEQALHIGAPISAALVGKGASRELWSEIAGVTGGRALVVKSHQDAAQFALGALAPVLPRITGAHVVGPDGATIYPATSMTLVPGDEVVAVMNTAAGAPAPETVRLVGTRGGKPYLQEVSLKVATSTQRVAQRWARQELARMELAEAPREEIVALSTNLGVLSPYTSLLVLESDEMYKQFQIERKQQLAQQLAQSGPTVTGGDLDSLGARQASLSPDEIQPGDPEIKIPAPADAQSVVVTFPFGETKLAVWDDEIQAWMVRFLIDLSTPDGVYTVRVTVTQADGRIDVMQLPYTVDTKAPLATITAVKVAGGYKLRVKQLAAGKRKDLDRAEVTLPDGTILVLAQTEWGLFEGVWATTLDTPVTLRVVVRDNALNQAVQTITIEPA